MAAPKGICRGCGKPVEASERAAYRVMGIELERGAGGANQIRYRRRIDGDVWHARYDGHDCVDRAFGSYEQLGLTG